MEAGEAIDRYIHAMPEDAAGFQLRAQIGRGLGDTEPALADIAKAIELDPENLAYVYDRDGVRQDRGEWAAAISDLTAALVLYPNNAAVFVERGFSHFRNGDDRNALEDAEAALAIDRNSASALWLKASALLYLLRHDEALEVAARGIALDPANVGLHIVRGRAYLDRGHAIGAIAALSEALELDPHSLEASTYRAAAAANLGFADYAREILAAVLQEEPNNAVALDFMASLLQESGDLDAALSALMRLTEMLPNDPAYWWRKGIVLSGLGYHTAVPEALAEAVALYGDEAPPELSNDYGAALIDSNRPNEAIAVLQTAADKNPENAWTQGQLGRAFLAADRNEEAVAALAKAVAVLRNDRAGDDFRLFLGRAYVRLGRTEDALPHYGVLVRVAPDNPMIRVEAGQVLRDLRLFDDAMLNAEAALNADPHHLDALLLKTSVFHMTERRPEMLVTVAQAIALYPDDPRAYYARAGVRHLKGAYQLALEDYNQALKLEPEAPFYLNDRADLLLKMGRLAEARRDVDRAIELMDTYWAAWVTLGEIMLETGEIVGAFDAFNTGAALEPSRPDAFFFRAVAHARLGNVDAARRDLASAASNDSGYYADRITELRRKLRELQRPKPSGPRS